MPAAPAAPRRTWWPAAAVAAVAVVAGLAGWLSATRTQHGTRAGVAWLALPPFEPAGSPYGARYLAISDDGTRVSFTSGRRLWIRRFDQPAAISVDLTASNPFFSADGRWIGCFRLAGDVGLVKVPVGGGVPVMIAPTAERAAGGTWRSDGTIVYATSSGLYQVSEHGGEPRLLARPDAGRKERQYAWPRFMPDGRSVLFTVLTDRLEDAAIARLDLETGRTTVVLTGGTAPRFVPPGRLVYAAGRQLMAVAVDPTALGVTGDPVALPGAEIATSPDNGAAQFAISDTGSLAFVPAKESADDAVTLSWIDRNGKEEPLGLAPGRYNYPRVSPDGSRIALDVSGNSRDIWIWHTRRASLTRLTTGPTEDLLPAWSVDGSRVYFSSDRSGNFDVYSQAADGSTDARLELAAPGAQMVGAATPDGKGVLLVENYRDLLLLKFGNPARLEALRRTESNEWLGEVSPDGKWIAYESDETSGRVEVFVRPFPDGAGRREQVSKDGGRYPKWNPVRSNELFYVDLDGGMRAATLKFSPDLIVGPATKLFDTARPSPTVSGRPYDVSPIDARFLVLKAATQSSAGGGTVFIVLNWFEDLAARVPLVSR
jgi:serine/threonine-protein kinase